MSQDPIRLASGEPNLYGYVHDPTSWVDVFGLLESVVFSHEKVIKEVTIQMQGSRDGDFKAANTGAGLNGKRGKPTIDAHKQTYGEVTWHHATYDSKTNTAVMQLVTTPDHEATLPHKGSVKEFEDATGTVYESAEAKDKAKELNNNSGCVKS